MKMNSNHIVAMFRGDFRSPWREKIFLFAGWILCYLHCTEKWPEGNYIPIPRQCQWSNYVIRFPEENDLEN